MNLYEVLSQKTVKTICEYFNGDSANSVYVYRSGSELANLYSLRFPKGTYIVGVSRWMLCEEAMKVMAENDMLSDFFNTMLSFKNIKKEKKDLSDKEIINERSKAIGYINSILIDDDYSINDSNGRIYFSKIDDEDLLIGEGGFAKVYYIPEINMVKKKLKFQYIGNSNITSRFKNEYKLLTNELRDVEGIIKAYDFDHSTMSYTMEFCDTDLKKYINENFSILSEEDKTSLIIDILSIMDSVHKKKVIHRDISPKNIFIKSGKPIIADFGLGKSFDNDGRTYVTVDTSYQGTFAYCDPRQFRGLSYTDKQSDIYSLGKIINFIMTKNSEDYQHNLTIISTIATENSPVARYSSIEEMIIKIKQLKKYELTGDYIEDCVKKIKKGIYDPSVDKYLLSLGDDDLIVNLYDVPFIKVYFNLFDNKSYEEILLNKLNLMHERLEYPLGLTFSCLDPLGNNLIKLLASKKNLSPAIKDAIGKCIYDIACGITRYAVQYCFSQNYKKIEPIYVQDTITFLNSINKLQKNNR